MADERLLNHADVEQIATLLEQSAKLTPGVNDGANDKLPSHDDGTRLSTAIGELKNTGAFAAQYEFDTVSEMNIAIQAGTVKDGSIIFVKEGSNSESGVHVIRDEEGNSYTQRTGLKFIGMDITDDPVNDETVVSIGDDVTGGSTITVTTEDSDLYNKTVILSRGTYSKSAVFSNEGVAVVSGFEKTGTISITVDDITKTMDIPYYGEYEVEVTGKAFYEAWLESISHSTEGYESLDDVLVDEKLLRELFTRHASVDFLVDNSDAEELSTIINNDYCAKWINLRDYALDTLYAVGAIKDLMDEANKYFYGEWALMPQVPKMTSNTAPYGEAFASSEYSSSYQAWKAFDNLIANDNYWHAIQGITTGIIGYKFPSAICIKQIQMINRTSGNIGAPKDFTVQGSNDGTNWVDIENFTNENNIAGAKTIYDLHINNDYYLYIRLNITSSNANDAVNISELQFYAWQPKGNVPIMTSNAAPWGEAFCSSAYPGYAAYGPFSKDNSINWLGTVASTNQYVGYKFTNPVCMKKVEIATTSSYNTMGDVSAKIQASNDGTIWVDLDDTIILHYDTTKSGVKDYREYNINNENYYLQYRLFAANTMIPNSSTFICIYSLQFYGRELKVSVPEMTSNTAPWGEASASSVLQESGLMHEAYTGFDGIFNISSNYNNIWVGESNASNQWLMYDFARPIKITHAILYPLMPLNQSVRINDYKYQASNDGSTWIDLTDLLYTTNARYQSYICSVPMADTFTKNVNSYRFYRVFIPTLVNYQIGIVSLNFYGLDYSEYDWDSENPRHYLYDHGVQLETLTLTGSITEESSALKLIAANDQASITIDTTDYTLLRGTEGQYGSGTNALICGSGSSNFGSTAVNLPYNHYLDITSINGNNATGVKQTAAGTFTCEEMWLE